MTSIKCRSCGRQLQEDERPCPGCGSAARAYEATLTDEVVLSDRLRWKHLGPGGVRKTKGETKSTRSRDPALRGQKVIKYLTVDEENRKHHKVVDADTGQTIHEHTDPRRTKKPRDGNAQRG